MRMNIAFVSYEYPPDTADGGIGTYTEQAARALHSRGHNVEVFAASREHTGSLEQEGIPVHRIQVARKQDFAEAIAPVFLRRHAVIPFDVIEGPDFNADAKFASESAPDVALVVRLHTPRYLTTALNSIGHDSADILPLPDYDYRADFEYQHAAGADLLTAPSHAIAALICRDWNIEPETVAVIPNGYTPAASLLDIPIDTDTRTVTFVGRLEQRKGVLSLAEAIPEVLRQRPDARFRFVGRPLPSPEPGMDMRAYLENRLAAWAESVEFTGPVPLRDIPKVMSETDICVFPSLWENFPCVCLEAMSAGRAIVGSLRGGMAEMLQDRSGLLVDPADPLAIEGAILHLLDHVEERREMGRRARERVLAMYDGERLAPGQEEIYRRAIKNRRRPRESPATFL